MKIDRKKITHEIMLDIAKLAGMDMRKKMSFENNGFYCGIIIETVGLSYDIGEIQINRNGDILCYDMNMKLRHHKNQLKIAEILLKYKIKK